LERVVTILLHMFREFSLDRYRGFRWFSWLTGVPTLWFVITLGITGYWLVWDELGLYVAILSSELMDAMPIVSASMARNFLEGHLTDRFFTLMGFLHLLGQPVLLIFAIWIHVKRLSNVEFSAPRGLAIGSFLALIAASLIVPAESQGPADMTQVPAMLNLDWFYLWVYPLLDYWTAGETWTITLSGTFLLMIMPWLPPKRTGRPAVVHLDECNGCGLCVEDCPFDAISFQARTDGAKYEREVTVHAHLCAACGICEGSCPSTNPFRLKDQKLTTGIDMPQFPADELRNRVDAAIAGLEGDDTVLIFGCDNAFDVSELAAPGVAHVSLLCAGMLPPTLVEYAQKKGVAGILITGCRTGDCYYRYGNVWLDMRLEGSRKPKLRGRADRDRICVCRGAETDGAAMRRSLAGFREHIAKQNADAAAGRESGQ